MSAAEPLGFRCPGCGEERANPRASAKDANGEWRALYRGVEVRRCGECPAPTIWTAAAGPVPVLDQIDRSAPLRSVPPDVLRRYYERRAEMLRPFAPRRRRP